MSEYIAKEYIVKGVTAICGKYPKTVGELIRCKDCKHWLKTLPDIGCCQNIRHAEAIWWSGDDFCSRAERLEE